MSRSRKSSAPSTLQVLRDTAMGRRRSHRARVGASLVAILATLALIAGSAPAYADDAALPAEETSTETIDVAAEETETPTEGAGEEPTIEEEIAPPPAAEEPETPPAVEPEPVSTETEVTETKQKSKGTTAESTLTGEQLLEVALAPENPDWIWQGGAPTLEDGEKDPTAYGGGSSEATDPATWSQASADTPKSDLLKYYLNVDSSGDILVSFGFTRKSNNGDTAFAVELNQLGNTSDSPPRPNRSPGDLLLKFHMDPSANDFFFAHAYLWTAAADFGDYPLGCEPMYGSGFGWCEIDRAGFEGRTADDNYTAEGRVNLTTLFENNESCSGFFNAVNLRGESSAENWTNSLQDYLETPGVTVPSTCATLVIKKFRDGTSTLLSGAEFDVYAGPDTTGTLLHDNLADGDAADTDGAGNGTITLTGIEPGQYTVEEVVPPTGYFLPEDPIQTETVGDSGTVTFEFFDVRKWQALNVTKTATGSYDVTYDWSIDKLVGATVNGPFGPSLTKNVPEAGDPTSAPFSYEVTLTQGARHVSDIEVEGDLLVDNPNDEPVDVTLSDVLSGATCSFDDPTVTVPANAVDAAYAYTCTYPDDTDPATLDTTNVGGIAWDAATYPQDHGSGQPLAGNADGDYVDSTGNTTVDYTASETNKNVTVTDDHHTFDPAWTATWTAEGTTETRTYTENVSAPAGSCNTVVNIAFVKSGETTLDQEDASATLCVGQDLEVSKVSQESLTREYLWSVDKVACPLNEPMCDLLGVPVLIGDPDTGEATATYTVTVNQDGHEDSAWVMSGFITVDNPNDWQPVTLTDLTDVYDGGGDCTIVASATNGVATEEGFVADGVINMTIAASQHNVYMFDCVFTSENPPALDGTNTATATWDAAAEFTPTGTASGFVEIVEGDWDMTPVNETVHLYDQLEDATPVLIGSVTVGDPDPTQFEYTSTVSAPPGECQNWDNTAWLSSSGTDHTLHVGAPSDAEVRVCVPEDLVVSKTAAGTYDRTYNWSIDKLVSADPESNPDDWTSEDSFTGDFFDHLFGYQVVLSQEPWQDSNWKLSGTITLTNGNPVEVDPISSTVTDTPDVGTAGVCTVDGGADDGDSLVGYVTPPIASGDHLDIGYECTFAAKPNYAGGNNAVTATNTSNQPYSIPVSFAKTVEHDKTVTVTDDKVTGPTVELTDADGVTYDEGTPDATYTFDYELTHTAEVAGECTPFVNHAEVLGDGDEVLDDAQATANICPNPGTWEVAKTSDPPDGGVAAGSDITYTLTATKTGGVNPENVVIVDDLSDLAPHVELPTEAELIAAAPAGTTVDLTGNVVTWTIAELSGTLELEFTVTVNADAHDVDLPNLIVSPGSSNCPDLPTAESTDECSTDHDTPHFLLTKSSDAGDTVMPPYLGDPGTIITYTLTVFNDSEVDITTGPDGTMPGATVTDDLTEVLDNATFIGDSIDPASQADPPGGDDILSWNLPDIPAGESRTLTYQVQVDADQWNQTLTNTATPGNGGDCEEPADCTTTTETPPFTLLQVLKVDAETAAPLAGAEFTLYQDVEPLFNAGEEPGAGDDQVDVATSGDDGLAQFTEELQRGDFIICETKAPEGYAEVPIGGKCQAFTIGDNFVENDYMSAFEFRDPATGQLAILEKEQFEQDFATGLWVPSDGVIEHGELVRYVVRVEATGPKLFHNVTLTDYVPGFNPDDTTSTDQGTYVPGSALCTGGLSCTVTEPGPDGLITWAAGTVTDTSGAVEFVIQFPELPEDAVFDENGEYRTILWNVGYLDWDETVLEGNPGELVHHSLTSNEVVIEAVAVEPAPPEPPEPPVPPVPPEPPVPPSPPQGGPTPPQTLPNTGGPFGWLPFTALGMIVLGAWMVVSNRRGRRLS